MRGLSLNKHICHDTWVCQSHVFIDTVVKNKMVHLCMPNKEYLSKIHQQTAYLKQDQRVPKSSQSKHTKACHCHEKCIGLAAVQLQAGSSRHTYRDGSSKNAIHHYYPCVLYLCIQILITHSSNPCLFFQRFPSWFESSSKFCVIVHSLKMLLGWNVDCLLDR